MKPIILLWGGLSLLLSWGPGLVAQTPDPQAFGRGIQAADLRPILDLLASDSLQGREAGTPGAEMAAAYIEARFRALGLRPGVGDSSYRQSLRLDQVRVQDGMLRAGNQTYRHLEEVICWQGQARPDTQSYPLVLGGRGGASLDSLDLEGRAVLLYAGFPDFFGELDMLRQKGAGAALVVISEEDSTFAQQAKLLRLYLAQGQTYTGPRAAMPVLLLAPGVGAELLQVAPAAVAERLEAPLTGEPLLSVSIAVEERWTRNTTDNVVAYLPGRRAAETVVITAHYDHLGVRRGKVFYGADDNASGVGALLEVAEAFAEARQAGLQPERSVVFMAFAAEEKGLLGSEYYASHPLFPLDQTVVNLNMDMVGHLDDAHGPDNPRFVSIVGSDWLSSELHAIHEAANQRFTQLSLDYTYNAKDHPERFYYRSDQYHFAKHGIPVIFYTSGDHEDYHRPSDQVRHIRFDRLEGVAQLVFYTAWEIAFRPARLRVDRTAPED